MIKKLLLKHAGSKFDFSLLLFKDFLHLFNVDTLPKRFHAPILGILLLRLLMLVMMSQSSHSALIFVSISIRDVSLVCLIEHQMFRKSRLISINATLLIQWAQYFWTLQ